MGSPSAKPDGLYQLIHSLSKSEKRYFKLLAGLNAGRAHGNLLLLFNALNSMEQFDEELLEEKMRRVPGNLSMHKSRLFPLILKSLRLQYEKEDLLSQLQIWVSEARLLTTRGLPSQARKRIKKAKFLATELEVESMVLELLAIEQETFSQFPHEPERVFRSRIEAEEEKWLSSLQLTRRLTRLHEQIRGLARTTSRIKTEEERRQFEEIIHHKAMNPVPKSSFKAFSLHQKILGIYYTVVGDYKKAWQVYDPLIRLWNEHPDQIRERSDLYLGTLNNYLNACAIYEDQRENFPQIIQQLGAVTGLPPSTELKFQRITYFHGMVYWVNLRNFQDGKPFFAELSSWLKNVEGQLSPGYLLLFYYNLVIYYFGHGENPTAYRWLLAILHFPSTEARQDIRDFARVFQVILQFELGNLDLKEYLLRSAYRYLRRNHKLHAFERIIVEFLKQISKPAKFDKEVIQEIYQNLLDGLIGIRMEPEGREPLGLDMLIYWTESKLAGIPMQRYFQQKMEEAWSPEKK